MKITIDKQSAVPYYHQVKEAVKRQVSNGELQPGDMLTTEFSLSEQLGISRLVVHRAYRELVMEGLLVRKRAVGTFVAPPTRPVPMLVGPLFSLTEMMENEGLEPTNRVLLQEIIPAGQVVGDELRLPAVSRVVHLRSLRMAKNLPFAIENMYYPYDRFPALAELDLNSSSIYATLGTMYGAHPRDALDQVTAGSATSEEAALLGLDKGAPIMRVLRVSSDGGGMPVEYSEIVFHAERYQLKVHLHRDQPEP